MAKDKLTNRQVKNRVDAEVEKFMSSVRRFLATKGGGELPPEWELSVIMLEAYYRQFAEINIQISQLDSLVSEGRYGPQPSPLLACRDKAATRLESLMKQMGLTMKASVQMNATEIKKEETPLDQFLKKQVEKQVEKR